MFYGKSYRDDMIFLLWCGEKAVAGDPLTPEEMERFIPARQKSVEMAKKVFRIKDENFAYLPGEPFKGR